MAIPYNDRGLPKIGYKLTQVMSKHTITCSRMMFNGHTASISNPVVRFGASSGLRMGGPPTVLSAKFSMPHAMAAVAARRSGGQSAFARDTLDDPAIARLRHAVRLQPYAPIAPWPNDRPARVTWRLSDGTVWDAAVENARGGADQPFSTDELLDKIDELTGAVFPAMSGVLRGLIGDPHAAAAMRWRDVVAQMIQR